MADTKEYRVEFFQLSLIPTTNINSIWDAFAEIENETYTPVIEQNGFTRDVWEIRKRKPSSPDSFTGQFRKFRTSNIPEKGVAGGIAKEIPMESDEGIIERNFFVFYRQHQLLGWHCNSHANTVKQFASFLQKLLVAKVSVAPLLQKDAMKRLMNNQVTLKRIELTIPRPTSPDLYPDDAFGKSLLELMNSSAADTLQLEMGVNLRRGGSEGRLKSILKNTLKELSMFGASKARAQVFEDGVEHSIDLIADRIISFKEVETDAKFPPSVTMYKLIDEAHDAWQDEINGYLGTMQNHLT